MYGMYGMYPILMLWIEITVYDLAQYMYFHKWSDLVIEK